MLLYLISRRPALAGLLCPASLTNTTVHTHTQRYQKELRCDPDRLPSTLNFRSIPSAFVPWYQIWAQSATELLRFQYLTPNDHERRVTLCARLCDNFHQIWIRSTYPFLPYSVLLLLIRYVTFWPWFLTGWPWKFVPRGQWLYCFWAKSNNNNDNLANWPCDIDLWPFELEHVWLIGCYVGA